MFLYKLKEKNADILNYNRISDHNSVSACMIQQLKYSQNNEIVTMVLMTLV